MSDFYDSRYGPDYNADMRERIERNIFKDKLLQALKNPAVVEALADALERAKAQGKERG